MTTIHIYQKYPEYFSCQLSQIPIINKKRIPVEIRKTCVPHLPILSISYLAPDTGCGIVSSRGSQPWINKIILTSVYTFNNCFKKVRYKQKHFKYFIFTLKYSIDMLSLCLLAIKSPTVMVVILTSVSLMLVTFKLISTEF